MKIETGCAGNIYLQSLDPGAFSRALKGRTLSTTTLCVPSRRDIRPVITKNLSPFRLFYCKSPIDPPLTLYYLIWLLKIIIDLIRFIL